MSIDLRARDARIGQLKYIVAENVPGHVASFDYQHPAIRTDQRLLAHSSNGDQDLFVRFNIRVQDAVEGAWEFDNQVWCVGLRRH